MKDKLKILGKKLINAELTVGTVEHCTSGLLGASISSICGLNCVYKGTIVTVDAEHMENLVEVSQNIFKHNGLVSSQVACQMALGGLYKLNVDICTSVVGNVDSNDDQDNVVWICIAIMTNKKVDFKYDKLNVNGLRGKNIEVVINRTLDILIDEIEHIKNKED